MNNLEQNALRIAELKGYKLNISSNTYHKHDSEWYLQEEIISQFSSYNDLMSIVFECKKTGKYEIRIIDDCVIFYIKNVFSTRNDIETSYDTEPEFIEAIQLACIKYLELKNEH